jgi:hypothetical protein
VRPETQQKIVKALYRAWSDLGIAVRNRPFSHSEGMQLIRSAIATRKLTPEFLLLLGSAVMPAAVERAAIRPEELENRLAELATEEKFENWLLSLPEPTHGSLRFVLRTIDTALPLLRKTMSGFSRLPHSRGVKQTELTGRESEICTEIKRLLREKVPLAEIFKRLATYGKSAKTIERLYYDKCKDDESIEK